MSRHCSPVVRRDDVALSERSSACSPSRGVALALIALTGACAADPRIVLGDEPGGDPPAGYTRFPLFSLDLRSDGDECLREREMYVRLDPRLAAPRRERVQAGRGCDPESGRRRVPRGVVERARLDALRHRAVEPCDGQPDVRVGRGVSLARPRVPRGKSSAGIGAGPPAQLHRSRTMPRGGRAADDSPSWAEDPTRARESRGPGPTSRNTSASAT